MKKQYIGVFDSGLGGLTTVSTDFDQMGRMAARMILDHSFRKIHCPFRMTRRNTF